MEVRYFGYPRITVSHRRFTAGFDLPANAASFVDEGSEEWKVTLSVSRSHPDHCAALQALLPPADAPETS